MNKKVLTASLCALFLVGLLVVRTPGFELIPSQGIGMGQAFILSYPKATTLVNIPSGGLPDGNWQLEAGFNRRFELSDLDQVFLVGAVRRGKITAAVGLSQFGKEDLYKELTGKLQVAYQYDSLSLGMSLSGLMVYLGEGYGRFSTQTVGLGIAYRYGNYFAAFTTDNLTTPQLYDKAVPFNLSYSLYAEVIGIGKHSLTAKVTWEKYEKPRFGFGQKLYLARQGAFFWGLGTEPMEYGGGIEFYFRKWGLSYATSYHPVLDFSHTISFSYGFHRPNERKKDGFK
ncbi:MAG: hypothetical protein JXA92_12720 [candidate division Zixibacteria bacterium]|nr:hypothetical protein [candidate division Zixibacteria bacterium]